MRRIRNVHERVLDAPASAVGELLPTLGGAADRLWPSPAWPPMRLDRPVAVGADGGHSGITYWVSAYEPGRRVRFTFHPTSGFDGFHEVSVEPLGPRRTLLRHVAEGTPRGAMRLLWPVAVRPVHDAVVEDLLDNAECEAVGPVSTPAQWSPWVRTLRLFDSPRARSREVPEEARLLHGSLTEVHFADASAVEANPHASTDPQVWADAAFRDPPSWVRALLVARESLVGLVGIERGGGSAFDTLARTTDEVLLGTDANHLDFRVSVLVQEPTVTLSTVVRLHNRRGRLYWAVVRHAHPVVVRSMLRRAARAPARSGVRRGSPATAGPRTPSAV